MPPKIKITKDTILREAIELVRNEGEGALVRSVVVHREGSIRSHHTDYGNIGKVMPLGYHLRAYQHVCCLRPEGIEQLVVGMLGGDRVRIHTHYSRIGNEELELLCCLLRSDTHSCQLVGVAVGAESRYGRGVTAVVALERVGAVFVSVRRQGH